MNTPEPIDYNTELYLCNTCGESKPRSEWQFNKHNNCYHHQCRSCRNAYNRQLYIRNLEYRRNKNREYAKTPRGRAVADKAVRKDIAKHPEKNLARYKVRYAVGRGKISKQPCQDCGAEKVEAHHYLGYEPEHWYDVQWLCRKHHWDVHNFSLSSRGYINE